MNEPPRGPKLDRLLMRAKDAIIIGTALLALIKWFYVNPMNVEAQVKRQEDLLVRIAENLDQHTKQLAEIEKQLAKPRRESGYHPKKGGWVMIKGKWYFIEDDEVQRGEER